MTQPKGLRLSQVGLNMVEARLKHISSTRWWFQIFFILTPNLGETIQFDEHIFQMGQWTISFLSIAKLKHKTRWGPWSLLSLWSQWPFRWSENKRCFTCVLFGKPCGASGQRYVPYLSWSLFVLLLLYHYIAVDICSGGIGPKVISGSFMAIWWINRPWAKFL